MGLDYAISAVVTLLVVVDPVGLAPVFISLTRHLPTPEKRRTATLAGLIAGLVLVGFAFGGAWLLRQLGISLPAFRIAGGLLLFAIAFEMVYLRRTERQAKTAEDALQKDRPHHIAAFPLAIPLLAGPGAITATLLLAGQASGNPAMLASLIGIIAFVALVCVATFCFAAQIGHRLGDTGNLVLSRLLGILLAALAVQYVIDGVRAAVAG
ncbi:MAG: MarC family protein [Rhizobiales bacterium]|nr:MarC family protein [Hyphomicrobiales bacterium]